MPTEAEALLFHAVPAGDGAVSYSLRLKSLQMPLLPLLGLLSLHILGWLMVNVQGGWRYQRARPLPEH